MQKFTYSDTKSPAEKFGVDVGTYVAKFLGTEDRDPLDLTQFGKQGTQQRIAWVFQVVEPAGQRGTQFEQGTGASPGAKTKFSAVLKGIMGRLPVKGEEIDLALYVGRSYRVEVEVNPDSDKGNLHIGHLSPLNTTPAAPAPHINGGPVGGPPAPPAPPKAPPPPPAAPKMKAPPGTEATPEPHYWIASPNGATERASGTLIRELVKDGKLSADTPCMSDDQSSGWKTVKDWGLNLPF